MVRSDFLGAVFLLVYLILSAACISFVDHLAVLDKEVIRKAYHIMIAFTMVLLVFLFAHWYVALLTLGLYLLFAYVLIQALSRFEIFKRISINRRQGISEVMRQMGYLFISFSLLITVFWGYLGSEWKFMALIGVMAWGFGDAAAAIVGQRLGKVKLRYYLFDHKKTREGSVAMFFCSALAIFVVLTTTASYSLPVRIVGSIVLGAVGSAIEALSHNGSDTVSLPVLVSVVAYPLLIVLTAVEGWLV